MAEQTQKSDKSPSRGLTVERTHFDKQLGMRSEARLTGAKQLRDNFASLREFDEGDEFVSNMEEDPRGSLSWTQASRARLVGVAQWRGTFCGGVSFTDTLLDTLRCARELGAKKVWN